MIKKQHTLILAVTAVIISFVFYFGTSYFDSESTEKQKKGIALENISQEYNEYSDEYLSFSYPSNWHQWSIGHDDTSIKLEIHSVSEKESSSRLPSSHLTLRIRPQTNIYKKFSSLEEFRIATTQSYDLNKDTGLVYWDIEDIIIQNISAIKVTERRKSIFANNNQYDPLISNEILFFYKNTEFYITYYSTAESEASLENLIERDQPILNQIIDSFKFKD